MADKKQDSIYKSVAAVFVISLVCRLFGFLREMTIGYFYGTGSEADTYFMAIRIFNVFALLFGSMWTTTYTPLYTRVYESDITRKKADDLTTKLLNIILLIALSLTVLLEVLAGPLCRLVAPGFEGEKLTMTVNMCRIVFPSLPFYALYYYFSAVLNSQKKFAIVEAVTIFVGGGVILGIVIFKNLFGPYSMAIGALMAYTFQFAFLIPSLVRSYKYRKQKPVINFRNSGTQEFFKLLAPSAIGVAAAEINNIVDSAIASTIATDGNVAALNYAQRINTFATSILITPIITVIFTKLSQDAAKKSEENGEFSVTLRNGIEALSLICIPLIALVMASGSDIIRIIYERNAFDDRSVAMTSMALFWYILGLVFYGYKTLFNRAFYAKKNTLIPMIAGFILIGANIVFDIVLKGPMGLGGLALANSIGMFMGCAYIVIMFVKKYGRFSMKGSIREHIVIIAGSAVAVSVYMLMSLLFENLYLRFFVPMAAAVIVYALICLLFKVRQFTELFNMLLVKLRIKKEKKEDE